MPRFEVGPWTSFHKMKANEMGPSTSKQHRFSDDAQPEAGPKVAAPRVNEANT